MSLEPSMVFYVYLDPAIIARAIKDGTYATQALISILYGFLQNCCIVEFKNYQIQENIAEHIKRLPSDDARKRIEVLLKTLQKRNRFLYCLDPTKLDKKSILDCVIDQEKKVNVDILLVDDEDMKNCRAEVEMASLSTYQTSDFERMRSAIAVEGMAFADGELDGPKFFGQVFLKALCFVEEINICDGIFGKEFRHNFEYSIQGMFSYLEEHLSEPLSLQIVRIHCQKPTDISKLEEIERTIKSLKKKRLSNVKFEVLFYQSGDMPDEALPRQVLPHQRYIFTNQIAFQIDPGMDFIRKDRQSGIAKNRAFSINYKNSSKVSNIIKRYSNNNRESVLI